VSVTGFNSTLRPASTTNPVTRAVCMPAALIATA